MGRGQGQGAQATAALRDQGRPLGAGRSADSHPGPGDERVLLMELAGLLAGRDSWPTRQEFSAAGQADLYQRVLRAGGPERWAREFDLSYTPEPDPRRPPAGVATRGARSRPERTETTAERRDRLIHDLDVLCRGRKYFPSRVELERLERTDIRDFIHRNGGVHVWSKYVGLPLQSSQDRRPYTLDQALVDGRAVLQRYGRIPARSTLAAAGHVRLFSFIQREFGGDRAAFAERCR